jgi:hypothetical protein
VPGSVLTGQGTVGAPIGVMSSRQQPDVDPKGRSGPIGSATTVGLVGCQLELWADELEEIEPGKPESIEAGEGSRG